VQKFAHFVAKGVGYPGVFSQNVENAWVNSKRVKRVESGEELNVENKGDEAEREAALLEGKCGGEQRVGWLCCTWGIVA
jgi:hypothetical protein